MAPSSSPFKRTVDNAKWIPWNCEPAIYSFAYMHVDNSGNSHQHSHRDGLVINKQYWDIIFYSAFIDIEKVIDDVDLDVLEENLADISLCDIAQEMVRDLSNNVHLEVKIRPCHRTWRIVDLQFAIDLQLSRNDFFRITDEEYCHSWGLGFSRNPLLGSEASHIFFPQTSGAIMWP